ncbi:malonyl-CoA decarboxylase, mitochondrial isoform X2 [Lampetra fluviatilis]
MWAALSRTRGLLHATASGGPRFDSRARHLSDRLGGRSEPLPSSHDLEVNAARLEPPRLQPGSTLPESTLPESTLPAEACRTSRLGAPQRGLDHSPSPMDPDPRGLTPPRPTAALGGPRARASPWPSDGVRRFVCSAAGRREEDKDGGGEELWGAALRAAVEAGPRAAARGDGEGLGAEEAATELARCYAALGPAGRRALLRALARDPHGVDHEAAATLAARVARMQGEGTRDPATLLQAEERLRQALAPRYKHLLVRLSRLEGGVKLLVDMRADALAAVAARDAADGPHLKELTMVLKALLSEWFSIGLLHLERVTWQSPCDMLQKIAQYEAVHPVRHWTDMRRRVGPYRRCFVFTHAAMPREPLVVLHVALTDAISSDIRSIVRESPTAATPGPAAPAGIVAPPEDAGRVRAAVFYSISATQRGLQGIDLGHHLIKHVVRQLQAEFPSTLRDFSSLSPIPGFTRWLAGVLASCDPRPLTSAAPLPPSPSSNPEEAATAAALPPFLLPDEAAELEALTGLPAVSALRAALSRSHSCPDDSDEDGGGGGGGGGTMDGAGAAALDWWRRADLREAMRAPLTRLCARYLVGERRRGRALDPVAHFHLRNGAEAWRLNWMADASPRALRSSVGLMANYRYWPERTVRNAADYERHGRAPASVDVAALAAAAAGHDDASKL